VSMGRAHTVFLSSQGHVWAFGCNRFGQLGVKLGSLDSSREKRLKNARVKIVAAVAATAAAAAAVSSGTRTRASSSSSSSSSGDENDDHGNYDGDEDGDIDGGTSTDEMPVDDERESTRRNGKNRRNKKKTKGRAGDQGKIATAAEQ